MIRLLAVGALTLVGCGGDDNSNSPQSVCEAAYEAGEGNAESQPRDAWIADCVSELGG